MTLFAYESQDNPKNDKVMHFNVNLFNQVMNTCIFSGATRGGGKGIVSPMEISSRPSIISDIKDLAISIYIYYRLG